MNDILQNPSCVTDNKCEHASAVNQLMYALDGVVPSRQQHQRRCIAAQLRIVDRMQEEGMEIEELATLVKADAASSHCPASLWAEVEAFDQFVGDNPAARIIFRGQQPSRHPNLD